jgi:hypothetical protein
VRAVLTAERLRHYIFDDQERLREHVVIFVDGHPVSDHAMDIDSSGETLALGPTTGSLRISENRGDPWKSISNHLPPVYCLRLVN